MPQKRNPVDAVLVIACARQVRSAAAALVSLPAHEHERAAGAWHAEWRALSDALALAGGAAAAARVCLEELEVDAERMRRNLDAAGSALLAERVTLRLTERLGRARAHALVGELAGGELPFREGLLAHLQPGEIDELLDPAGYLGSAAAFVDRALAVAGAELP